MHNMETVGGALLSSVISVRVDKQAYSPPQQKTLLIVAVAQKVMYVYIYIYVLR